jgi:hypothetical protein
MPFQEKLIFLDHVNFFIKLDLMNVVNKPNKIMLSSENFYNTFSDKEEFQKYLLESFNLVNSDVLGLYSVFVII